MRLHRLWWRNSCKCFVCCFNRSICFHGMVTGNETLGLGREGFQDSEHSPDDGPMSSPLLSVQYFYSSTTDNLLSYSKYPFPHQNQGPKHPLFLHLFQHFFRNTQNLIHIFFRMCKTCCSWMNRWKVYPIDNHP